MPTKDDIIIACQVLSQALAEAVKDSDDMASVRINSDGIVYFASGCHDHERILPKDLADFLVG